MSARSRPVVAMIFVGIVVGAIYRFAFVFTPYWLDIVIVGFLSIVLGLILLMVIFKGDAGTRNASDGKVSQAEKGERRS